MTLARSGLRANLVNLSVSLSMTRLLVRAGVEGSGFGSLVSLLLSWLEPGQDPGIRIVSGLLGNEATPGCLVRGGVLGSVGSESMTIQSGSPSSSSQVGKAPGVDWAARLQESSTAAEWENPDEPWFIGCDWNSGTSDSSLHSLDGYELLVFL